MEWSGVEWNGGVVEWSGLNDGVEWSGSGVVEWNDGRVDGVESWTSGMVVDGVEWSGMMEWNGVNDQVDGVDVVEMSGMMMELVDSWICDNKWVL